MRLLFAVCIFSAAMAVPAAAEETAQPEGMSTTSEAWLNKVVCKKQPPPTGSRIGGKTVCLTNREWQQAWQESSHLLNKVQNKGLTNLGKGG